MLKKEIKIKWTTASYLSANKSTHKLRALIAKSTLLKNKVVK